MLKLDVGCGTRKIRGSIGVDLDLKDNDVLADTHFLPFNDDLFPVIHVYEVLEHCRDPYAVLLELKRVLAPGGVIYLSVPNIYRVQRLLCFWLKRKTSPDKTHLYAWDEYVMRQLLEKIGLTIANVYFYVYSTRLVAPRTIATSILFVIKEV